MKEINTNKETAIQNEQQLEKTLAKLICEELPKKIREALNSR